MSSVLVLNQNYEPLNVCNTRRALVLVDGGKAEGFLKRSIGRGIRCQNLRRGGEAGA